MCRHKHTYLFYHYISISASLFLSLHICNRQNSVSAGYLKMDTLLYVWDQYVIGLDVPGFGTEWLAAVCATMLGLLQDKLMEAKSVSLANRAVHYCLYSVMSFIQYLIKVCLIFRMWLVTFKTTLNYFWYILNIQDVMVTFKTALNCYWYSGCDGLLMFMMWWVVDVQDVMSYT